jgi:hypothetical protein
MTLGKIRGLEFDRSAQVLLVTFQSGRRFRFVGIDAELFDALRNLETRDRVFSLRIADHFAWVEQPAIS